MRLERLTYNKIKIFLTTDDLSDRGLTKEDIWKDSLKWHQLFHEMLEEANEEFGVDFHGSVAVEIFSIQAQGMIMIVTIEDQEEENLNDPFLEMHVSFNGREELLFSFIDFEDVIQLSKRLQSAGYLKGSLYHMNQTYYFYINDVLNDDLDYITAILAEYGQCSFSSIHYIEEYGKRIIENQAVKEILQHFR
ncbi:genetic competence negative regulator [Bacillus massilinigeriensis]|uniref:genetic competence negative regulator n=1 Tax=Bacillus massilionigeriensis TaxID=1805475 RepID=UPI00096B27F2|nr:genetic competence negative regulator [Bacillus massilionigeriensis]